MHGTDFLPPSKIDPLDVIKKHNCVYPIKGEEICRLCHINERQLRRIFTKARKDGELIGSCNKGYYYIRTIEDSVITIQYLLNRITSSIPYIQTLTQAQTQLLKDKPPEEVIETFEPIPVTTHKIAYVIGGLVLIIVGTICVFALWKG